MGKVTNKDIAERAGVSAAAVSLAIHGRKGISEATRANILRIVQEMNYAPPSRSCTDSRAVVLIPGAGLRMPPPALLQGIADFAAQQRAQLHILTLQQLMEDFPAKLTGCMLLVTFDELDRSKLDLIASASPDILVLDGNFSRKPFFNVRWDYAAAAYRLVCWLTQLGHRNFVYINEDFSPDKNLIVFSGFQRQILQMHLPLNPVQLVMDYMKNNAGSARRVHDGRRGLRLLGRGQAGARPGRYDHRRHRLYRRDARPCRERRGAGLRGPAAVRGSADERDRARYPPARQQLPLLHLA